MKNADIHFNCVYREEGSDRVFDMKSKSLSTMNFSETDKQAGSFFLSDYKSEFGVTTTCTNSMPSSSVPISKPPIRNTENSSEREQKSPKHLLPAKYSNTDVPRLFPDFYVGKISRFPRSFNPEESPAPSKIWENGEQRRKLNKFDDPFTEKKIRRSSEHVTPPSTPVKIVSDHEGKCFRTADNAEQKKECVGVADWRFGPAQLWYDMLNVPENGEGFDYGFKLKKTNNNTTKNIIGTGDSDISDESFLMVVQIAWEDDIIWDDDEETKQKIKQSLNHKAHVAGWLPYNRTAQISGHPFNKSYRSGKYGTVDNADDIWYSIFPIENEELVNEIWEDEIIWDPEAVSQIPTPKLPTLNLNDENIIFNIPDDIEPQKQGEDLSSTPMKIKTRQACVKKYKFLSNKSKVNHVLDKETPPIESPNKDPFNISNDSYYLPKTSEKFLQLKIGGENLIQHSTPVIELQAPFIQTQIGPARLRNFHRTPLKRYSCGALALPGPHRVTSLTKYINKMAKEREQQRIASGGGNVFFMRTPEDLTGRDGELILIEFSEEYPPLMNQVGMCSKIRNYYKRKATKHQNPTNFRYGEIAYAQTSPFLGSLPPGKSIQAIENNMYRAPIYEHKIPQTDFLVIRTRHQYYIREIDGLFTAGQLCPLYEVPSPNSKIAINFVRDFLLVFIYRLFLRNEDTPKRIKFDDIKKAFPSFPECTIRKRLKLCADYKRFGPNSHFWVLKPDFRLPSEEEIRTMVSPEQYCAYFSAIAAKQRLNDAGYGEKSLFTPEDNDGDLHLKIEDEVKAAPWNTTRAYIQAVKGKCMLQLTGPADPTGCGEGFSYIQVPIKPTTKQNKEQETQSKKILSEMGADLKNLSPNNARKFLKKFGVPAKVIKKLNQWEVIEAVRTLSTKKAKIDWDRVAKFSLKNKISVTERQERYEDECQRIFDLQNGILSSSEVLSTDEGESSDDDNSDIEEMSRNIEDLLTNKKTIAQLRLEREEQERKELRKMLREDNLKKTTEDDVKKERVLKIYRTFRDTNGNEFTRTEVVRNQAVIDAYVKVRTTKNGKFIKQLAVSDDDEKKEIELSRKGNHIQTGEPAFDAPKYAEILNKTFFGSSIASVQKRCPVNGNLNFKMRCGACGAIGHMRTNRSCPRYQLNPLPRPLSPPPTSVADVFLVQKQENEVSKQTYDEMKNVANVENIKPTISNKLIKHHEDNARQSEVLKKTSSRKRHASTDDLENEYHKKHYKSTNGCGTDRPDLLVDDFETTTSNEIRNIPNAEHSMFPVNAKMVPDYCNIMDRPTNLQTMRENLRSKINNNQIVQNSSLYIVLESIVNRLTEMSKTFPFIKAVEKKMKLKCDVERSMDLEIITKKVKAHEYCSKNEFLADVELMFNNCAMYSRRKYSEIEKTDILLKAIKALLEEYDTRARLTTLEQQIQKILMQEILSMSTLRNTTDERQTRKSSSNLSTDIKMNTEFKKNLKQQINSQHIVKIKTKQISDEESSSFSSKDDETNDDIIEEMKTDQVSVIGTNMTMAKNDIVQLDSSFFPQINAGDVVDTTVTKNKNFAHDCVTLNNSMLDDKRQYLKLTSGVSVELNVLLDDLEISDEDDEMNKKKQRYSG